MRDQYPYTINTLIDRGVLDAGLRACRILIVVNQSFILGWVQAFPSLLCCRDSQYCCTLHPLYSNLELCPFRRVKRRTTKETKPPTANYSTRFTMKRGVFLFVSVIPYFVDFYATMCCQSGKTFTSKYE